MNRKTLFFSWQSDTSRDCNWNAISHAAKYALTDVEAELDNLRIDYLESTSNTAGSPNIREKIFERIAEADIVLCDITTINQAASTRKTPNPNVLIELGYAAGVVGWDRIILVFNEVFGAFPDDLPFDISQHRVIRYKMSNKTDASAKGQLKTTLKAAIKVIVEKNPPKLFSAIAADAEKRRRDITTLKQLMSSIHLPTFNLFLNDAPKYLNTDILHYWHGFDGLIQNSQFHLYDEHAAELVAIVHKTWNTLLSFGHRYRSGSMEKTQIFGNAIADGIREEDPKRRLEAQQAYQRQKEAEAKDLRFLEKEMRDLRHYSRKLFGYIREHYIEIDLEQASAAAYRDFNAYHEEA